ncbi:MAG: CRISPR-associated endonuclease Cas2 [Planctomycetes bacterium]|jgi:CRISPR-associated protein Cas2|nr:CRISPR-associated endonuclease Cas2 [Planctomycetota bacterium]
MSRYLIAYDISEDRRRSRVHRWLKRWGDRIQYSVFEAELEPRDLDEVCRGLTERLDKEDECTIVPVLERPDRGQLNWQHAPEAWTPAIVLAHPEAD